MNLRRFLGSLVTAPASRVLRKDIREAVEQALATRSFVVASELRAVEQQVDALKARPAAQDPRVAALEERVASLEKKLSMAMGAVQASTATLTQVRGTAEEALTAAKQAVQLATTARATAESAAEGVGSIEDRLEDVPAPASTDDRCRVDGCESKHRAKGFCARHYQQWRRSALESWVGPDGAVLLPGEGMVRLDPVHAGGHAVRAGGALLVDGKAVQAQHDAARSG